MLITITIVIIIILFVLSLLCKRYCYQCPTINSNNTYQINGDVNTDNVNNVNNTNYTNPFLHYLCNALGNTSGNTINNVPSNEDIPPKYTDIYTNDESNYDSLPNYNEI